MRSLNYANGFEARTCITSSLILTLSVYSFRIDVALLVIALTLVASPRKTLRFLSITLPFTIPFVLAAFLLGGVRKIPTVFALICVGSLLIGIQPERFGYALMYFRIPPRFAYSISIAVRMFHVLVEDTRRIVELLRTEKLGRFEFVSRLLKSLSAIAVLRAISMAEVLYSRGIDLDRRVIVCERPKLRDYALLLSSISILLYTYLTRSGL